MDAVAPPAIVPNSESAVPGPSKAISNEDSASWKLWQPNEEEVIVSVAKSILFLRLSFFVHNCL